MTERYITLFFEQNIALEIHIPQNTLLAHLQSNISWLKVLQNSEKQLKGHMIFLLNTLCIGIYSKYTENQICNKKEPHEP